MKKEDPGFGDWKGNFIKMEHDESRQYHYDGGNIGLYPIEKKSGACLVVHDVEKSGIQSIYTEGLTGCMGLAIFAKNSDGTL